MPEGGALAIEVKNVQIDDTPHVRIAVRDTGVGMEPATRARIFEPFFTTKEIGKGTGLGLSTVYGIIKQSNGHIDVESELGQGTTFKVYLPAVAETPEQHNDTTLPQPAVGGAEAILLVEDDPDLRELLARTLTRHGYQLVEAATGVEALQIIRDMTVPIDLLITDAVLPGLPGPAVAREAEILRPGIRVLFVSGYTDDAMLRLGLLNENQAFLQKPFGSAALLRKVRQQLDRTPAV
jgi:CheY-like chemotaxis protein